MRGTRPLVIAFGVPIVLASLVDYATPGVQESPSGRVIAVAGFATDSREEALAKGTLQWGNGDCMVIEIDQAYLVVFPHGTTLGENDDVALPNALSAELATKLRLAAVSIPRPKRIEISRPFRRSALPKRSSGLVAK
jgi:hypothetical protein